MKKQAFTLVELIVVVTILAVLGTIGFVSLQGYTKTARDSVRISDLKVIQKSLELELTKNDKLPYPTDYITVTASGTILGYQGYIGGETLGKIGISEAIVDPIDNTQYNFATNQSRTKYQLLGFLEAELTQSISSHIYANNRERYPLLRGTELGILFDDTTKQPVQELGLDIDIENTSNTYEVYLNNDIGVKSGSGNLLVSELNHRIYPNGSCSSILKNGDSLGDGIYDITPNGGGILPVYCDMENGGWAVLIGVSPDSTHLSYNSSEWITPTIGTNLNTILSDDIITQGYSDFVTNKIKICKADFQHCFEMEHSMNRTLQSFYVDDVSYINFSRHIINNSLASTNSANIRGPSEIGEDRKIEYFYDLGINYTPSSAYNKYGVGINIHGTNKIGFQADNNNAWPSQDNMAFGIGGFSSYPAGCSATTIGSSLPLSSSFAESVAYHHICSYYSPSPDQDRWYILGQ